MESQAPEPITPEEVAVRRSVAAAAKENSIRQRGYVSSLIPVMRKQAEWFRHRDDMNHYSDLWRNELHGGTK